MTVLHRQKSDMSDFTTKMNEYINLVETNLKKYNAHSAATKPQKNLIDAMNYSLEAGGKRIRPVLIYAFCEALGGDLESQTQAHTVLSSGSEGFISGIGADNAHNAGNSQKLTGLAAVHIFKVCAVNVCSVLVLDIYYLTAYHA